MVNDTIFNTFHAYLMKQLQAFMKRCPVVVMGIKGIIEDVTHNIITNTCVICIQCGTVVSD